MCVGGGGRWGEGKGRERGWTLEVFLGYSLNAINKKLPLTKKSLSKPYSFTEYIIRKELKSLMLK